MTTPADLPIVLDGLKTYMEHGINLNPIADKFAKGTAGHKCAGIYLEDKLNDSLAALFGGDDNINLEQHA